MKKLIALIGAVATAFGLYAADVVTDPKVGFETDDAGFSDPTAVNWEAAGWTGGTNGASVVGYEAAGVGTYVYGVETNARRIELGSGNANFLKLETGTNTLSHGVTQAGTVFFDQLVQFTGFEEAQTNLAAGTKIAVWLSAIEEEGYVAAVYDEGGELVTPESGTKGETNLYVTCGNDAGEQVAFKLDGNYQPDTWYRVTIKSLGDILPAPTAARLGFIVYIDGVQVKTSAEAAKSLIYAGTLDDLAKNYQAEGQLFPAITDGDAISSFGYCGIGKVDDVVADNRGPDFARLCDIEFLPIEGAKITKITDADGRVWENAEGLTGEFSVKRGDITVWLTADEGWIVKVASQPVNISGDSTEVEVDLSGVVKVFAEVAHEGLETAKYAEADLYDMMASLVDGDSVMFVLGAEITNGVDDVKYYTVTDGTTIDVADGAWSVYIDETEEGTAGTFAIAADVTNDIAIDGVEDCEIYFAADIAEGATVEIADDLYVSLEDDITVAGTFKVDKVYLSGQFALTSKGKVMSKTPLTVATAFTNPADNIKPDVDGEYYTYELNGAVSFTLVPPAHATVTKVEDANGTEITAEAGAYEAEPDAVLTVTLTADDGYFFDGEKTTTEEIMADDGAITLETEAPTKAGFAIIIAGDPATTNYYTTFTAALNAVASGNTIALFQDVTDAVGIKVDKGTGFAFTIDFNGHTYTVTKPGAGSSGTEKAAFQFIKGQTITLKNGTIQAAADNLVAAVAPYKNIYRFIQNYANLTLENMMFDTTNLYIDPNHAADYFPSAIEVCYGTVALTGSTTINDKTDMVSLTVDSYKTKAGSYDDGADVTINTTGSIASILCYSETQSGATGEVTDPSDLVLTAGTIGSIAMAGGENVTISKSADVELAAPADYKWDANGNLVKKVYVAQIGDDGEKFETLAEAVAAADANDEITLLADTTLNATLTIAKALAFNLNDKTITFGDGLKNGIVTTEAAEELVISNGAFAVTGTRPAGGLAFQLYRVNALIKDVTMDTTGFEYGLEAETMLDSMTDNWTEDLDYTITCENVDVTGNGSLFHFENVIATLDAECSATAAGTPFGGAHQAAIYSSCGALVTIEGGTYEQVNALQTGNLGGDIVVNGGTFNGDIMSFMYKDDDRYPGNEASITITNGTFNGNFAFAAGQPAVCTKDEVTWNITGGKFQANPSDYLVAPYVAEGPDGEGYYSVAQSEEEAVAMIGDKGYPTLQAAFAAVADGQTIQLLDNVELTDTLAINVGNTAGEGITLDLNGYTNTLSKSDFSVTIENTKLTIANGVVNATVNDTIKQISGEVTVAATAEFNASICYLYQIYGGTLNVYGTMNCTYVGNGAITLRDTCVVNIEDGAVLNCANYPISLKCEEPGNAAVLNINGGTISSYATESILGNTKSADCTTVNINGGVFNITRALAFSNSVVGETFKKLTTDCTAMFSDITKGAEAGAGLLSVAEIVAEGYVLDKVGGDGAFKDYYVVKQARTVTLKNGDDVVDAQVVPDGQFATNVVLAVDGFKGWTNETYTAAFDFATPIEANLTLYAWIEAAEEPIVPGKDEKTYKDETEAQKAAESRVVVPTVTTDMSEEDVAAFDALFTKTAVQVAPGGEWKVAIDFTTEAAAALQPGVDAANTAIAAELSDTTKTEFTATIPAANVKPGLWYGIAAQEDVAGMANAQPAGDKWVQATKAGELALPAVTKPSNAKGFFKVVCAPMPTPAN